MKVEKDEIGPMMAAGSGTLCLVGMSSLGSADFLNRISSALDEAPLPVVGIPVGPAEVSVGGSQLADMAFAASEVFGHRANIAMPLGALGCILTMAYAGAAMISWPFQRRQAA